MTSTGGAAVPSEGKVCNSLSFATCFYHGLLISERFCERYYRPQNQEMVYYRYEESNVEYRRAHGMPVTK